jgi:predicted aspartyl protease
LDFDSVVAHVNFGMLTLQKVKLQYPIYVYISNHCFVQTLKIVRRNNGDQGKTDTTPVTSDKAPGSVGGHKLAPEAGMFIKAKVNGVITNLLIDTGATVTLIVIVLLHMSISAC